MVMVIKVGFFFCHVQLVMDGVKSPTLWNPSSRFRLLRFHIVAISNAVFECFFLKIGYIVNWPIVTPQRKGFCNWLNWGTPLWAVVNDALLKVKGYWILAESHHALWGRLTFASPYWFTPPKNPYRFGPWTSWNPWLFCKQSWDASHTHKQASRIQFHSMTWSLQYVIITHRKWVGVSSDISH